MQCGQHREELLKKPSAKRAKGERRKFRKNYLKIAEINWHQHIRKSANDYLTHTAAKSRLLCPCFSSILSLVVKTVHKSYRKDDKTMDNNKLIWKALILSCLFIFSVLFSFLTWYHFETKKWIVPSGFKVASRYYICNAERLFCCVWYNDGNQLLYSGDYYGSLQRQKRNIVCFCPL